MREAIFKHGTWSKLSALPNRSFVCGFCSHRVSSIVGYSKNAQRDGSGQIIGALHICPNCTGPNYFFADSRFPSPALGNEVNNVPADLYELYQEARRCTGEGCYTAAVLICRKMLMNIAVTQGADEGKAFIHYVSFLADNGYVPPNGRHWVDHIRKKGNEATHEIAIMKEEDAKDLIVFIEMLLRFIYEFPAMVPNPPAGN
ncbi:DUF4145 domain-containing protein [Comamonas terrae]|uniref:DUF4145 domain-containing protein n=1 Tax=Comamonas terrae TaxID=673548 RepID=A0ABW5UU00_9BURK|nr:DUF4145 domain-containing protein [Comamonas terrae]